MVENNIPGLKLEKVNPEILMPLPNYDFDPTESAIPWKVCHSRGWEVAFSTEYGDVAHADPHKLKGPLPGLLSASIKAQAAYREMTQDSSYQHPIPYAEIVPDRFEALLLPGGDAPGVRPYLESQILRSKVLQFYQQGKLIGAICHGTLVLARTIDPQTGHSVLYGHKVTALPKSLDRLGYQFDSWLLNHGYIMYPSCVAEEVRACLEDPEDFFAGPGLLAPYVVSDGNLITSRWYMDAQVFAECFSGAIQQRVHAGSRT